MIDIDIDIDIDYAGDQVLEWDGSSLQDATFEEARDIMSRSGDTVQVVLMHCRYHTPVHVYLYDVHARPWSTIRRLIGLVFVDLLF